MAVQTVRNIHLSSGKWTETTKQFHIVLNNLLIITVVSIGLNCVYTGDLKVKGFVLFFSAFNFSTSWK